MALRSRQQRSPRSLISPAPIMMRKRSQRAAQTPTLGGGIEVGTAPACRSGQKKMARKPVSRSCDSHPNPYGVWPTFTNELYSAHRRKSCTAEPPPVSARGSARHSPATACRSSARPVHRSGHHQKRVGLCQKPSRFFLRRLKKWCTGSSPFSPRSARFCVRATVLATVYTPPSQRRNQRRLSQNVGAEDMSIVTSSVRNAVTHVAPQPSWQGRARVAPLRWRTAVRIVARQKKREGRASEFSSFLLVEAKITSVRA
eukprot:scaffold178221_cov32-Tisochrysis_lutea.AAC.1